MIKPLGKIGVVKYCLLVVYLTSAVYIHQGRVLCFGEKGHVGLECHGELSCDGLPCTGYLGGGSEHKHSTPVDDCGDCIDILPIHEHIMHARVATQRLVKPADVACLISNVDFAEAYSLVGVDYCSGFPMSVLPSSQVDKCLSTTVFIC